MIEKGNFSKAQSLLRQWVSLNPVDISALYDLIVFLDDQGQCEDILGLLKKVPIHDLVDLNACLEFAYLAFKWNDEVLALKFLGKSIAIKPQSIEKWSDLAQKLMELGKIQHSVHILSKVCQSEVARSNVKALAFFRLGIIYQDNQMLDQAIVSYQKALALEPSMISASMNLGNALSAANELHEALKTFELALQQEPNHTWLLFNKALVLDKLGSVEASITSLALALQNDPDNAHVLFALGGAYLEMKDYANALKCCETVLTKNRFDIGCLINKGIAQHKTYQLPHALSSLNLASILDPSNVESHLNLGNVYKEQGDVKRAHQYFEFTLIIEPEHVKAKLNLAMIQLQMGQFSKGWSNYERRWHSPDFVSHRLNTQLQLWDGKSMGGHLLLWAEQGVGDEVMFGSLIREAKAFVKNVSVLLDSRLIPLFKRSIADVGFYDQKKGIPNLTFDAHCPLGTLPLLFRNSQEAFNNHDSQYLVSDQQKVNHLRKQLAPNGEKVIGLSWFSTSDNTGFLRSVDLIQLLQSIASHNCIEDLVWVSLQYGEIEKAINVCKSQLGLTLLIMKEIDNFDDLDGLASLISACDTVVSVDNSTVMLSSALGKNTQVLLPLNSDWRWGERDSKSFWFPNVKTYRKSDLLDWTQALERLATDFSKF